MNKSNFLFRFSVRRFCIRGPSGQAFFARTIYIYVLAAFNQPANILLFPRITHKSLRFSLFFNIFGTQCVGECCPVGVFRGGGNTAFCDEKCEQNEGRFCSMWPLLPDKKNDDFGRFHRDGVGETVLLSDRLRGLDVVNLWFYSSRTMVWALYLYALYR